MLLEGHRDEQSKYQAQQIESKEQTDGCVNVHTRDRKTKTRNKIVPLITKLRWPGRNIVVRMCSHAERLDMIFINVNFNSIRCRQTNKDLDVTHGFSHNIRIKNWFSGGNANYHPHLSFRSREGVIFLPMKLSETFFRMCSHAKRLDMIFINVNFNSIRCRQTNKDLDVTHGFSHNIRIKNWFSGGNANYHPHLSFRSREGVIFLPMKLSETFFRMCSHAKRLDMIFINVNFNSIRCRQTNKDLDVTHGFSHNIRITNWFSGGNANYHRHLSFLSREGVIFLPMKLSESSVNCVAVALYLRSENWPQNVLLSRLLLSSVKQVSGSNYTDNNFGNDKKQCFRWRWSRRLPFWRG
ncbi:Hypothetical predicted protein [Paramuricea clavata]|uniref:Uncharacterized protein n=1 Tax=Paramuricea clavata TaxID=317549 RepID=A0A7D9HQ80_PARCT|nr:Hypothetical predicted protein [Paramuricea clavata]